MKLLVISHKPCWSSTHSPSGYATDGGFAFQMQALSELFDATQLLVPCLQSGQSSGEILITGHNLTVIPITNPSGKGIWRRLRMPFWLARNSFHLLHQIRKADVIHTPIPGDIGTIGMLLAQLFRKPLFVRHCGNWLVQKTVAERFWKWFMERFAGGKNIMLVTGGAATPPSLRNPNLQWIFSTSLTAQELKMTGMQRQEISSGHLRLVIACRQEKEKGTRVVIDSMPLILKNYPGVTLDVLGDGSALEELKDLSSSLGLQHKIKFHGKVNHQEVMRFLQQSDIFCYPTTASEGFPKAVLEALACGLPVITTPVSVLPQLIARGGGILIEEASPEALARAVGQCLADTNRYRSMSKCAVNTAQQYSLEKWRDTIGQLLQNAWGKLGINA